MSDGCQSSHLLPSTRSTLNFLLSWLFPLFVCEHSFNPQPAKAVFLTDGTSRTGRIGTMTIQLRKTTPKNMATGLRCGH
ncbi:MAG: DUF6088 family protein [Pirellula sp.]